MYEMNNFPLVMVNTKCTNTIKMFLNHTETSVNLK